MDRPTRILVIAQPGHSRQSLVALLKTIPCAELFLAESSPAMTAQPPHLVLVDLGGLHPLGVEVLKRAAQEWPAARKLVLVDDIRRIDPAYALGADCALPHNTPAGELLHTVQQLSQDALASIRMSQSSPAFLAI